MAVGWGYKEELIKGMRQLQGSEGDHDLLKDASVK